MEVNVEKERLKDYEGATKKYFRPIKIEEITIMPPWYTPTQEQHIIIEPGMAFGTGRHESTKLMFKLMKHVDMKGKKVLDIGCGSGILSLYANLIGAKKIIAVDNDLDAVLSAKRNISLNQAHNIELICTDLLNIKGTYDIVLANLDVRTFTDHSQKIINLVKKHGYIIISGVLGRDKKSVFTLFPPLSQPKLRRKIPGWGLCSKLTISDTSGNIST